MMALLSDMSFSGDSVRSTGLEGWTDTVTASSRMLIMSISTAEELRVLKGIREHYPTTPVLAILTALQKPLVTRTFEFGATSCVDHKLPTDQLKLAIAKTLGGQRYIAAEVASVLAEAVQASDGVALFRSLSPREADVFRAIVRGSSYKETAAALHISVKTVSTLRKRILTKLRLKTNADVVRFAVEHGV